MSTRMFLAAVRVGFALIEWKPRSSKRGRQILSLFLPLLLIKKSAQVDKVELPREQHARTLKEMPVSPERALELKAIVQRCMTERLDRAASSELIHAAGFTDQDVMEVMMGRMPTPQEAPEAHARAEQHELEVRATAAQRNVDEASVKELKNIIAMAGMSYADCVEKSELRVRAREAQVLLGEQVAGVGSGEVKMSGFDRELGPDGNFKEASSVEC